MNKFTYITINIGTPRDGIILGDYWGARERGSDRTFEILRYQLLEQTKNGRRLVYEVVEELKL